LVSPIGVFLFDCVQVILLSDTPMLRRCRGNVVAGASIVVT